MKKLFKAIFSSSGNASTLRSLDSINDLQMGDYIKLNDSFALPKELRGKTFQVSTIDSYYYGEYGESLSIEWALKGDTKKKVYLSLTDKGGEDRIVLSYQLKTREVEAVFGWQAIKEQYNPDHSSDLLCKNVNCFEGWLDTAYHRRECAGKGFYLSGDYRNKSKHSDGEPLTYYEFYNADDNLSMDIEVWGPDEVDVFISILRPESDIHEFWAG